MQVWRSTGTAGTAAAISRATPFAPGSYCLVVVALVIVVLASGIALAAVGVELADPGTSGALLYAALMAPAGAMSAAAAAIAFRMLRAEEQGDPEGLAEVFE